MHKISAAVLVLLCAITLVAVASAKNEMGISDIYRVTFSQNLRVADTLLPQGDYEIRHIMEGTDHIMVFRQLGAKKPIEVRAKCTLVPLTAKADHDQTIYIVNASNDRVLQELIFKGDRAKHVF
jgi:hypothetical protein